MEVTPGDGDIYEISDSDLFRRRESLGKQDLMTKLHSLLHSEVT